MSAWDALSPTERSALRNIGISNEEHAVAVARALAKLAGRRAASEDPPLPVDEDEPRNPEGKCDECPELTTGEACSQADCDSLAFSEEEADEAAEGEGDDDLADEDLGLPPE